MKKISLLVFAIVLILLAGCGGDDNNNTGSGNNVDTINTAEQCIKIARQEIKENKRTLNMLSQAQQENEKLKMNQRKRIKNLFIKKYTVAGITVILITTGIILFFILSVALKKKKRKYAQEQARIENKRNEIAKQLKQNREILQEIEARANENDKKIKEVSFIEARTEAWSWEIKKEIQEIKSENDTLKDNIEILFKYVVNRDNKIKYLINKAYQGNPVKINKKLYKMRKERQELERRINEKD